MIDRFRNDEKRTWNQGLLANSESCVMTHHMVRRDAQQGLPRVCGDAFVSSWRSFPCVVTDYCTKVVQYMRRDGGNLASWRYSPGGFGCSTVVTDHGLRHDGLYTYTV